MTGQQPKAVIEEQPPKLSNTKEILAHLLELIHGTAINRGEILEYIFNDLEKKLGKTIDISLFRKDFYDPAYSSTLPQEYETHLATTLLKSVNIKDPDNYLSRVRNHIQHPPIPPTLQFELAVIELEDELDAKTIATLREKFTHSLNRFPPYTYKAIEDSMIDDLATAAKIPKAERNIFVGKIAAKAREERIYTTLNQLLRSNGFVELVNYLDSLDGPFDPRYNAVLRALDTPLVAELLAKFMAQEKGIKAFSSQQIKLQPHDIHLTGLARSYRSNIQILLGHYYSSHVNLFYYYALACMRTVFYGKYPLENTKEQVKYFKEARSLYRKLTDKQRSLIQVPEIISCRKKDLAPLLSPDWKEQGLGSHTAPTAGPLHISALSAMEVCRPYLLKAISHGDLYACDIYITLLQTRLRLAFNSFEPNKPVKYAAQLYTYQHLLDQQLLIAQQARNTNPGPGHMLYGHVLTNFLNFYAKQLTLTPTHPLTQLLLTHSPFKSEPVAAYINCPDPNLKNYILASYVIGTKVNIKFASDQSQRTAPIGHNGMTGYSPLIFTIKQSQVMERLQKSYLALSQPS